MLVHFYPTYNENYYYITNLSGKHKKIGKSLKKDCSLLLFGEQQRSRYI
jgi:hypothetical protein